ncbi:hypothetical protein K439DRAFT_1633045 [Ramaria rubella]|nr:hypothetical protein K439DRAFT_1633045 [Ramaria rubella]
MHTFLSRTAHLRAYAPSSDSDPALLSPGPSQSVLPGTLFPPAASPFSRGSRTTNKVHERARTHQTSFLRHHRDNERKHDIIGCLPLLISRATGVSLEIVKLSSWNSLWRCEWQLRIHILTVILPFRPESGIRTRAHEDEDERDFMCIQGPRSVVPSCKR